MKARCRARLAATVTGAACALGLPLASAHAAEPPRSARPNRAAVGKPAASSVRAAGPPVAAARRVVAGAPAAGDTSFGAESPDLRALREAERELFPPAAPSLGETWPSDLPFVMPRDGGPQTEISGVPPAGPSPPSADLGALGGDLGWIASLELPDLPVRWDERVVRYLEFFRDDPRGRATFAYLFRRSGRVVDMMRRELRAKGLPVDLVWVSMIESGFDPVARSAVGAAGLWQFMPETARVYGLSVDRWLDQRYDAELATAAAADLLGDLHRRFGSWELALAAYNMGYAGVVSVVRRYNTNDFWSLSRIEGSLPWETTLYVPKILAAAVVAHNLAAFGFADLAVEGPVDSDSVDVPPGTSFGAVAQAIGCDVKDLEALNPELRAGRTPPAAEGGPAAAIASYPLRVPAGKGAALARALGRLRRDPAPVERYVVRFGETLDQIAAAHKTTAARLVELNSLAPGETLRGGTVLLVPGHDEPAPRGEHAVPPAAASPAPSGGAKQSVVVVPAEPFAYAGRKRVFYRVLVGDTLGEIAAALHVSVDDLRRWNDLDVTARLEDGMTLQAFVAPDADLSRIVVVPESDVHVVTVGSDEFFASLDHGKRVKRVVVAARAGDTPESIGRRFKLSARTMERINRRGRGEVLRAGEPVVVYLPGSLAVPATGAVEAAPPHAPAPNGPLPYPPLPGRLP